MATKTPAPPATQAPDKPKRGFKFPTAFTILFLVLVLVWALTFIIKPGSYAYVSCDGGTPKPIPGTFANTTVDLNIANRLYDLWLSPVNGLYGIRAPSEPIPNPPADIAKAGQQTCGATSSGQPIAAEIVTPPADTGPYNAGDLAGAAAVFFFVLAIGAFITVTIRTGALDAGVSRITQRFRTRGLLLIGILMVIFSIGGTTYGMAEETLGFYAIVVPVIVGIGYDRMVGVSLIMVGAGVGTLASTVNPFATGVASAGGDVALGNGIALRILMYLVLTAVSVIYVLRYARKVHAYPTKSLVPGSLEDVSVAAPAASAAPLTARQRVVLWIVGLTFGLMIFSVIPWSDFSSSLEGITLGWYFPELAALFIVAAVIVGLVGRLGEEGTVSGIIAGAGDFIGAALIIAVARGVTVIMNNAYITDSVLHSLESLVTGLSAGVFAVVMYFINIPLAFLVPSSSGHATLAMPILAPLGDFASVSRAMVVTAYQSASGWVNLFTPTSAIIMGGLALGKVRYDRYLRFVGPLLGILLVLTVLFMLLGIAVPALGGT
ncbi:MAG: YfcC family protein [Chloroflexi bacterium]|nr:MAG: YfcC family protein [Chloroflexota bacterium]